MSTAKRDYEFFRNYFAGYEMERPEKQVKIERDFEDCNCAISCCFRFLPEVRLHLRTWYHRLTPQGRTAFLNAHLREASPGHVQYRFPTPWRGSLEKVCMFHFQDTLHETKERVRAVILEKRKPLEDDEEDFDLLPVKRYKKGTEGAAIILDRMARGLSYRTRISRRLMPARKVKAPCDAVCRYKCYEKYTLEERQAKLKELLQLPLDKQRQFLSDHVCKMAPIRTRVLNPGNKRLTIYYFFHEGRQLQRVCKTMFLNTYDITDRRLRELLAKKGANAHVVCGNPMMASVLKKYQYKRMIFDVDEGLDKEMDRRILEEFLKGGDCDNLEVTQQEVEYEEISIEYGIIKQELDETEQDILPDGPPASIHSSNTIDPAQLIDEIDPVCNGVVAPSTVWIKQENMEVDETPTQAVKAEVVHPEAEQQQRLVVPLPRCDDLDFDPRTTVEADSVRPPVGSQLLSRLVKPHCGGTKCNMQCHTRVSDELRLKLLADLHQMSPTAQRKFIGDHICATTSVLPRVRSSKRQLSNYCFLPVESCRRLVKVCRRMFCSSFDLSAGQLREIIREKGADKHVVCGNPNFPLVLKRGAGYYFAYDAGMKAAEEACKCGLRCSDKISKEVIERLRGDFQNKIVEDRFRFLSKYVQLPTGDKKLLHRARFFLPPEESSERLEEVCRKMFVSAFKVEWDFVRVVLTELEASGESIEHAKAHIEAYRMDEDHLCEIGAAVRKLSRCPNVAQMYNEYLEGLVGQRLKPIDYQQYFGEFSQYFAKTGLMLPTRCPDCGFFSKEEMS